MVKLISFPIAFCSFFTLLTGKLYQNESAFEEQFVFAAFLIFGALIPQITGRCDGECQEEEDEPECLLVVRCHTFHSKHNCPKQRP